MTADIHERADLLARTAMPATLASGFFGYDPWLENGYADCKPYRLPRAQPLTDVTVGEILETALGIEKGRWTQTDQNRVARCLITMGFTRCKARRPGGRREWRYRRIAAGSKA